MSFPHDLTYSPQAQTAQSRRAHARRRRAAAKPAHDDPATILCDHLARLADRNALGAVGLAGAHAMGTAGAHDPLDVLVWVDLDRAQPLGEEIAEAAATLVTLYDARRLPWAHPLHLAVRWVNVSQLPRIEIPQRARSRVIYPNGAEALVPLDTVPHFVAVERPRAQPVGACVRQIPPPPIGGFLV